MDKMTGPIIAGATSAPPVEVVNTPMGYAFTPDGGATLYSAPAEMALPIVMGKLRALRAVLAPLLDEPFRTYSDLDRQCVFCGHFEKWAPHDSGPEHAPDCAYLRRDELLG